MAYLKRITWLGTSREDVKAFPDKVRKIVGAKLMTIQPGYSPADSKPMSSIGPGVNELRVRYEGQYRVIYIAKFSIDALVNMLARVGRELKITTRPKKAA